MEEFFKKAMMSAPKREKKIYNRNMRVECHIDCTAESVMECIGECVSQKLYEDMMDYLLGFNDDMQLEIADNLLDAVCYGWEHYIGIHHIDMKLKSFYLLIEEEMTHQSLSSIACRKYPRGQRAFSLSAHNRSK